MSWSLFPASTCDSVGANRCWEIPARAALKCCNDFSAVRLLRGAGGAVAAHSCRRLLVSLLHAASPRTNLDVTADYSNLDPHVSCVKTSHPAAQLDVNPEQRSVRQSMMSGPHHRDRAHIHTTFGTPRKFIRALSSRSGWLGASRHRLSVNVRTTAMSLSNALGEHASARDRVTTLSQAMATPVHNPRHTWTLTCRSPDSVDSRKRPWTRQIDFPSRIRGFDSRHRLHSDQHRGCSSR